jgi:hypothetical protein
MLATGVKKLRVAAAEVTLSVMASTAWICFCLTFRRIGGSGGGGSADYDLLLLL